jgi:hypothetical protein
VVSTVKEARGVLQARDSMCNEEDCKRAATAEEGKEASHCRTLGSARKDPDQR